MQFSEPYKQLHEEVIRPVAKKSSGFRPTTPARFLALG